MKNIKHRLLFSATTLSAVTAIALTSYARSPKAEMKLSALSQPDPVLTVAENPDAIADRAIYSLNNPDLQFVYFPNQFVISSSGPAVEENAPALVDGISIWTKDDYVAFRNAGDEVGDMTPGLRILIRDNPEGLPLLDWVNDLNVRSQGALSVDMDSIESTSVAGQEGLSFVYSDLYAYQNVVVKEAGGDRVIMISYVTPRGEVDSNTASPYSVAFEQIVESLSLTRASVNAVQAFNQ